MKLFKWIKESFLLARQDTIKASARVVNGVIVDLDERRTVLAARLADRMEEAGMPNKYTLCLLNDRNGLGYKE
jgi:hypothetical protein